MENKEERHTRIPSKLSKIPKFNSARIQRPDILRAKENTDSFNDSSVSEAPVRKVLTNPKKRHNAVMGNSAGEPNNKRIRNSVALPSTEVPKKSTLKRTLPKKGRRSLQKHKKMAVSGGTLYGRDIPSTSSARPISAARKVTARPKPASKFIGEKHKPLDLKGQNTDLKEALSEANKQIALQNESNAKTISGLENEHSICMVNLEKERNALNIKLDSVRKEVEEYRELNNQLKVEKEKHCTIISKQEKDLRDFEDQNKKQKAENEKLLQEKDQHLSLISKQEEDLRDLEEKRRKLLNDVQELKVEKEKHCSIISKQEKDLRDFEDQNKKQKAENEKLLQEKDQHLSLIAKQEEDLQDLEEKRRKLLNDVQELKGNIRVFCRVRPVLKEEEEPDHINYEGQDGKCININNDREEIKFNFDQVFGPSSTQLEVFKELSMLVQSCLDGYNVCVFAYGQTGSGKTYTMEGPEKCTDKDIGIIPRAMKQIFLRCQEQKKFGWEYELAVEHIEIYCDKLHDLLREKESVSEKLEIRTVTKSGKSSIWVSGLTSHPVKEFTDVKRLLQLAKRRRATAATEANERSSRSHSVFKLTIKARSSVTNRMTESTLNLIDLAGSERVSETGSSGNRLKEAKKINGSLSVLSRVITSLSKKDKIVPYRDCKLTLLLKYSLGGNSKTLMVININPTKTASAETIRALSFASMVNDCNIGTAQKVMKYQEEKQALRT